MKRPTNGAWFCSSGIANMLFLKRMSNDMRPPLTAVEMAAQAGNHFSLVGRPTHPQNVGLDVLVEELVGVQFGAVAGQPNQAQRPGAISDELLRRRRPMHRVSIHDQIELARGPS